MIPQKRHMSSTDDGSPLDYGGKCVYPMFGRRISVINVEFEMFWPWGGGVALDISPPETSQDDGIE